MSKFAGFPGGQLKYTPLPDLFFSELLPQIDSLAELKVTLHVLWLLYRKQGTPRYVTFAELQRDSTLLRGLAGLSESPVQALREGLQQAVVRGTLLRLASSGADGEQFYFANSAQGRKGVEKVRSGELQLTPSAALDEATGVKEPPNIFVLYEQNIGLLQPLIADELKEAEAEFPAEWIEDAFRIAVEQNVRNWKYIRRILERWRTEGKGNGKGETRDRTWYTDEESRRFIRR